MKLKRYLSALLALTVLVLPARAYEEIPVTLDGSDAGLEARLIDATTYVPAAKASSLGDFTAAEGEIYVEARGRILGGSENRVVDGELYVPIRSIAKIAGLELIWHAETSSISLSSGGETLVPGDDFYDSEELYWLSRIIMAESGGEPFEGKVLVGNVVLNRVSSSEFPSTVFDVIFDAKYGVQFSPTVNGMIYREPSSDSLNAAKLALEGYSLSREALYFLNPRLATSFWIVENRRFLISVGGHDFYA